MEIFLNTSATATKPAPTGRMVLLRRRDGTIVGDTTPGVIKWEYPGNHWSHSFISTPMARGKLFTEEEAREIWKKDPSLELLLSGWTTK